MRLISQDGTKDAFYENAIIKIRYFDKGCVDIWVHTSAGCYIMGEYSTKEKALKVMEMLKQAYIGRNEALNLDMTEGVEEELLNTIKRQGFGTLVVQNDRNNSSVEFTPLHTYFKFPADEEVDV